MIMPENTVVNKSVYGCIIHLKKQIPGQNTAALYTLIERLDRYAVGIHKPSVDSQGMRMGLKVCCKTPFYKPFSPRKNKGNKRSPGSRRRVSGRFRSRVRFAAQRLDGTLASEPPMFSRSNASQESQVVMECALTDGVVSLHHRAFKS